MKTILHVIDTTGPGGAETVFIELADRLSQHGFHNIALIRGKGWVADELGRRGISPFIVDCKGSFNRRYLSALVQLIRANNVDLIQSHLLGSNVYCSIAGLLTGTPVVSTFHGVVDVSAKERFKLLKFMAINLGSRDVIGVTRRLGELLIGSTPLWKNRVRVIYNGIDARLFAVEKHRRLRETLGIADQAVLLGALGNIRPAKAYHIAIEAIRKLADAGIDAHLAIAGDARGALAEEMRATSSRLGVDSRVHFLGFIDDAPQFLAGIDIFVLSSESEGHPLALTQAMAAGLPIVATRCGVEEIVEDRVTATLVQKNDPQALADGIAHAIENPAATAAMAARAQQQAFSQYDLNAMLNAYIGIYRSRLMP